MLLKALALLCVFCSFSAFAEHAIPPMTGPVLDHGDFFLPAEESQLDSRLRHIFSSGGPQMAVWTLQDLDGEDIASLAIRTVDVWKLGREKEDDGLLLLIARTERRTRLEVGQGLEGAIPDIIANRMLQGILRPALRANEAADGVNAVISAVEERVGLESSQPLAENGRKKEELSLLKLLFMFMFFVIFFALPLAARLGLLGAAVSHQVRRRGHWTGHGGWGGGGFGRGGGGWSGGGGGFSGGGSSGSW